MNNMVISDTDRINYIAANCGDELSNPCWIVDNPEHHEDLRATIDELIREKWANSTPKTK